MKTLMRLAFAGFILLLCLSVMNMFVALFVPSLRAGAGLMEPVLYNAKSLVVAPTRVMGTVPGFVFLLFSIVTMAVLLRWAFGGGRHEYQGHPDPNSHSAPDTDMESMARDLHYTAKRLEERLEALETILLERSPRGH